MTHFSYLPMSNLVLKDIPIIDAVQVLRYRTNPETGVLEPWPVATCEIDRAGRVIWRGDAGRAYEPLLRATKKAGAVLVHQTIAETLAEAESKKEAAGE